MRMHLALFYFYGLYYHWSKRATGKFAYKAETALNVWDFANCCHDLLPYCQQQTTLTGWCRNYKVAVQFAFRHNAPCRRLLSYAAGVRYMFIGKLFEHRPSYHLLGVLLFIQLGITSASWAIRNVMQSPLMYGNAAKHAAEAQVSSNSDVAREQKAVVLEVSIFSLARVVLFFT